MTTYSWSGGSPPTYGRTQYGVGDCVVTADTSMRARVLGQGLRPAIWIAQGITPLDFDFIALWNIGPNVHPNNEYWSIRSWLMGMTPEGRLKKQVKEYLKSIDAWWYMPVQNGMGVVGIPDLMVCYKGLLIGIETKAPMKRPTTAARRWEKATPNQQARIQEIRKAGGIAEVVDHLDQVKYMIENADARIQMGVTHIPADPDLSLFEDA